MRDWIARLNQSADCYCGFSRKSQFVVKLLHATQALVDAAPRYSDTLGILRDSFAIEDDVLMIENQLTGRYDHNWVNGTWRRGLTLEDVDAQTAVGEIRPYELRLYCTRNPTQAFDITNRRLTRRKYPYRVVSFESDMGALTIDLGDLVRITHFDGLGASGWTDRAAWILRHEFDPARFVVAIDALDVDYLINPLVEDASWMATVERPDGSSGPRPPRDPGTAGTAAPSRPDPKPSTPSNSPSMPMMCAGSIFSTWNMARKYHSGRMPAGTVAKASAFRPSSHGRNSASAASTARDTYHHIMSCSTKCGKNGMGLRSAASFSSCGGTLIPLSITFSILRFRLFDIDVIIRRTLVYTILTALLGLVYFGGVTLLQNVSLRLKPFIFSETDFTSETTTSSSPLRRSPAARGGLRWSNRAST